MPNQLALDRLLGNQPHRPTRPPRRRRTAHHGNDALALLGIQKWLSARARRIVKGPLQPTPRIALADLPGHLRRDAHSGPGLHRRPAMVHLPQNQRRITTRTYARILRPGIASALGQLPIPNAALRRCFDKLELEINAWTDKAQLAA
jgi:hypothetical protein